jgi:hypothetical protein
VVVNDTSLTPAPTAQTFTLTTGADVLNIKSDATTALAGPTGAKVVNVETLNIAANGDIGASTARYDVSGFTGLTTLKAASGGDIYAKAATTTDATASVAGAKVVNISGGNVVTATAATGAITVDGASSVTAANATGAVSVTGAKIASAAITSSGTAIAAVAGGSAGTGDAVTVSDVSGTTPASTSKLTSVTLTGLTQLDATATVAGTRGTAALTGDALTSLTLAKGNNGTVTITNGTDKHTLSLTLADTGASSKATKVVDATAATVAITSNGTANVAKVTVDGTLKTVTATGAGKLTLDLDGTTNTAVTSVDASATIGGVVLSNVAATAVTILTGSGADSLTTLQTTKATIGMGGGNDTLTIGSAIAAGTAISLGDGDDKLLNSSGSIAASATSSGVTVTTAVDGGAGVDAIAASLVTAGNGAVFTGFEALVLDLASGTLDTALLTGSTITALAAGVGGGAYTNVALTSALTYTASVTGTTELSFAGATGSSDGYTANIAGTAGTTATALAPTTIDAGILKTNSVENLTVNSGGTGFVTNLIDITGGTSLKTVTIAGSKAIDVDFAGTNGTTASSATGLTLVDGSAATGALNINTTNVSATALTVKSGSGADVITLAGAATVDAGAGDDSIVLSSGGGTVTGGAGADTFDVSLAVVGAGTTEVKTTITDLAKGDIIEGLTVGTAASLLGSKVDVSAATTLALAIEIANGATNATATAGSTVWFQYAGNSYILEDALNGTTSGTYGAEDTLVVVNGLFDLSKSVWGTTSLTIA